MRRAVFVFEISDEKQRQLTDECPGTYQDGQPPDDHQHFVVVFERSGNSSDRRRLAELADILANVHVGATGRRFGLGLPDRRRRVCFRLDGGRLNPYTNHITLRATLAREGVQPNRSSAVVATIARE